jgi:hypothetical protein
MIRLVTHFKGAKGYRSWPGFAYAPGRLPDGQTGSVEHGWAGSRSRVGKSTVIYCFTGRILVLKRVVFQQGTI